MALNGNVQNAADLSALRANSTVTTATKHVVTHNVINFTTIGVNKKRVRQFSVSLR